MTKKNFITIGVFGVIAIGVFFLLNKENIKQKGTIKIGVILPLTGNGAIYGADLKKGIEFAHNESDIKAQIKLFYEDDAADTKTGINAFNSLKARNIDIIIGGVMSNVANGLLPIADKEKMLLLSPKATDPKLSKTDDYFFRIWPTDDVDGKVTSQYITDSLHLKRIAIFYPNVDYGVGIKDVLINDLKTKDVQIVYEEGYLNGVTDFKTQLLKIKNARPDVLFLPAYYKEAVIILKQMNELNCNFYVAGASSFYENDIADAAGKLKDKVFFSYPLYSMNSQNTVTQNFIKEYKLQYNENPNAFVAHGYDSYKVLEQNIKLLIKNKQPVSAEDLKKALNEMDIFHGVTGDFRFDNNGDVIKSLQIIWLKNI